MTSAAPSIFNKLPGTDPLASSAPATSSTPSPAVTTSSTPTPSDRHPGAHPSLERSNTTYVPQSSSPVSGVIGPRMRIKGDIEFEGELMIQGQVFGNITCADGKGILRIDEKAEVTGNVEVPVVKVAGLLRGELSSSELVHLQPTGTIEGPVKYNSIQLENGGTVSGSLTPEFKNARK